MEERERLARLDDLVVEGILEKTDEEALADVADADVDRLAMLFAQAKTADARSRLVRARTAVRQGVPPMPTGTGFQHAERPILATLAARGARGGTDADQAGIDDDLAELRSFLEGDED